MKHAKPIITLTLIAVVAALLLAGVDSGTAAKRAEADRNFKLASLTEVLPAYDNEPDSESYEVELATGKKAVVYPAKSGDRMVGTAVELSTPPAYGGTIRILVGLDDQDRVNGIKVLPGHQETPGLGAKVEEEGWRSQFTGKGLDEDTVWKVKKDDPNGFVDAVTGATITSRAITEGTRAAVETVVNKSQ